MIRLALALGLLSAPALAADDRDALNPAWSAIYSREDAWNVRFDCATEPPKDLTSTWTPTTSRVKRADELLGALLRERLAAITDPSIVNDPARHRAGDYYRQFYGLVLGGRQVIYINGFSRRVLEPERGPKGAVILPPLFGSDWREKTVDVCDGGYWFFSAKYDVASDTLGDFSFNFNLGDPVR